MGKHQMPFTFAESDTPFLSHRDIAAAWAIVAIALLVGLLSFAVDHVVPALP